MSFAVSVEDVENFEVAALPLNTQRNIEADSFWCMSKLLDGIQVLPHVYITKTYLKCTCAGFLKIINFQDNYTFAQPGIQNKVKALEELVNRIDGKGLLIIGFRLPVLYGLLKLAQLIALYFSLVYSGHMVTFLCTCVFL